MNRTLRTWLLSAIATPCLIGATVIVADEAPIPAAWKVQEINYSYLGFTTLYSCDAVEDKVKEILKTLGAHPKSKVRATGCPSNRPSRNFFLTITLASPVPVADAKLTDAEKSKQELLKRLGAKNDFSTEEFPAIRKSVELSRERRLNIEPGDCELLEGLRDNVLPKMNVKIEEERIRCTPNQLSLSPPQLKVSALVKMPSADVKESASKEGNKESARN